MLQMNGFQLLGHILQQLSPKCFSKDGIAALEKIADCIEGNEELESEFYVCVVLEMRIWIYCNEDVQIALLKFFNQRATKRVALFKKIIGLQPLLGKHKQKCECSN